MHLHVLNVSKKKPNLFLRELSLYGITLLYALTNLNVS